MLIAFTFLLAAAAPPASPSGPPLPDISPLAPAPGPGAAAPDVPLCPSPPPAPAGAGLTIAGIAFAPGDIAAAEQAFDPYTAQPVVRLTFTGPGHRKFLALQQGCVGEILEIRLDGELLSEPYLAEPIEGAEIMISGQFTLEQAAALAGRLGGTPAQ